MRIKSFLVWLLCGSVTFILTACYGGPVRSGRENIVVKSNNDKISGLKYVASAKKNTAAQK